VNHAQAISFSNLPAEFLKADWRFHPREFVGVMRTCGWLSIEEFAQCIPRTSLSGSVSWNTAILRARTHSVPYNKFIRVFSSGAMQRYVQNIAQSLIETGLFRTLTEDGRGVGKSYGPFYGRGYHQLTWAGNFRDFGKFKNFPRNSAIYNDPRITSTSAHPIDSGDQPIIWSPRYDPSIVEMDAMQAASASGFYWVSKRFRATSNINRLCDESVSGNTVGFISWLVNGGGYGYANRQQFANYLTNILLDEPTVTGVKNLHYPSLSPTLTGRFPLRMGIPQDQTLSINYERQAP
jgi:hypothetical protein